MDNRMKARFGTLIVFIIIFEAITLVASHFGVSPEWKPQIVLSLFVAASFGGRALAYFTVFEWLRHPFTKVVTHSAGVGEEVEPRTDRGPVIEVIGAWVCCPMCSVAWAALGMAVIYSFFPEYGALLIYVIGAAGVGSALTRWVELKEWERHLAQEQTGRVRLELESTRKMMEIADKIEGAGDAILLGQIDRRSMH